MDVSTASHDYVVKLLMAGDKVIRFEVERDNDTAAPSPTPVQAPALQSQVSPKSAVTSPVAKSPVASRATTSPQPAGLSPAVPARSSTSRLTNNGSVVNDDKKTPVKPPAVIPSTGNEQHSDMEVGVLVDQIIVRIIFKSSVMMVIVDVGMYLLQTITIVKAGGPLGLSIVGGADLICYPFGVDKPGTFVSKVRHLKVWQFVFVCSWFYCI